MKKTKCQKIEAELDKIIIAEINDRFAGRQKKQNPRKVKEIIEKKNREIVKTHQKGKTASNLPLLFSGYLQIQEGGKLYFGKRDLDKKEFESYLGKKNRLEALAGASLNTLREENLINIVYRRRKIFDDEYRKAKEVTALIEQTAEIRQNADEPGPMIPKDEETAVSYLKEIAPLKSALQKIESRYIELKEDFYIADVLQQLQSSVNLAFKSITLQTQKTSRFLFDQARAVFQKHKTSRTGICSIEEFVRQKEELVRYYSIFDSIGDDNRKKQTKFFISTIETAIGNLQKDIVREKQRDTKVSEKSNREVQDAYERFLEIKKMYSQGKLDEKGRKKKAISGLKKCRNILKSNGQRVKAREVERFLNATGIDKKEETKSPDTIHAQNIFYKRAFLAILPVTIALAILNAYHILSGYEAEENKAATVTEQAEKEKKTVKQQHKSEAVKEARTDEDKTEVYPPSDIKE
ncbi:hypothetical protein QUF72_21295 [Desulfobacterales bacterium HSG2]|nr:hypothetical protein [Desulfobacterales bacterium HSG2]